MPIKIISLLQYLRSESAVLGRMTVKFSDSRQVDRHRRDLRLPRRRPPPPLGGLLAQPVSGVAGRAVPAAECTLSAAGAPATSASGVHPQSLWPVLWITCGPASCRAGGTGLIAGDQSLTRGARNIPQCLWSPLWIACGGGRQGTGGRADWDQRSRIARPAPAGGAGKAVPPIVRTW